MKKPLTLITSVFCFCLLAVSLVYCQTDVQAVPKDKLDNFYNKVNDWFNEINNNLENGINQESLTNKENEIVKCLQENNLGEYQLNFDKQFRNNFLASCGLAYAYPDDFRKFSRFKPGKITLNTYWKTLLGNFKHFYALYQKGSSKTNFADVEMPVKVLKLYLNR